MDIPATGTTENSDMLPVTSTETPENLDQSTLPVVDHSKTNEALEQTPVTNTPPAETALPQVTNIQGNEQTTLQEVTQTHETAPSGESSSPPVTSTQTSETLNQSTDPPLEVTKTTETVEHSVMESDVTDQSHDNLIASPENQL